MDFVGIQTRFGSAARRRSLRQTWFLSDRLRASEELPEGSWYCLRYTCWICKDVVKANESSSSSSAIKCMQCTNISTTRHA